MIHLSSFLRNALLGTSPLQTLINSSKLYVYSGPVPADADAALDASCALLATVSNGGTGVTFAAPTNGVLQKTAAETWTGAITTSGNAAFYRLCVGTDDGSAAASAGNYRVQGSIGTDASYDLIVANAAMTSGGNFPIDQYQLVQEA